jgi:acyl-CoA thioester hydrolase
MFSSETKIKVRYAETDMMGVVYHANYLIWMEIGRTELVQNLGLSYKEMEDGGYVSPVIDIKVSYKRSARYGDEVTVITKIEHYDSLRTRYGVEIFNQKNELLCTAKVENIVVKKENFRPVSLRKAFPNWHEIYEKNKIPE